MTAAERKPHVPKVLTEYRNRNKSPKHGDGDGDRRTA